MTNSAKILVVDDERGMRDMLEHELIKQGYRVEAARDGEDALQKLKDGDFQLVISDMKMPRMGGLEMLAAIKRINPDVEVILATGFGTVDTAVMAMKCGAYDFIQKPFSLDELLALIEKALEKKELKAVVALYEASKAMFHTAKLETLLPVVAKLTRAVLRADDVSIMLAKGDALEIAAALGFEARDRAAACLALARRAAERTTASGEPLIAVGPLKDDPRFAGVAGLDDIGSSMVYPLRIEGERLGMICVNRVGPGEPFNAADLQHVAIFGSQIALAVHNANAFKRLEEAQDRLAHSQRMEAVGRLASDIAHELNNPLSSILGLGQLLLKDERLDAQHREDLEAIVAESRRCATITRGLLQFGRKRELKKEPLPVRALLDSVLKLARLDAAAKDVEVVWLPGDPGAEVSADLCQMQQVFLNLIVNATHAMELSNPKRLEIGVESAGGRVLVRFKDNGCGISPENLGKVFEPFFTTKPRGKGTGLGLAVCRDIVLRHGGAIKVSGDPGGGAIFTVELPSADGGASASIERGPKLTARAEAAAGSQ